MATGWTKTILCGGLLGLVLAAAARGETGALPPEAQADPVLSAMHAELQRAQERLRLPDQPVPYFIEMWVQDSSSASLNGKYGALSYQHPDLHPRRAGGVVVRVGDYAQDNTNLPLHLRFSGGDYSEMGEYQNFAQMPVEGGGATLRTALWLMADAQYKRAVADFQKKKMMSLTTVSREPLADFSRQSPVVSVEAVPALPVDLASGGWKETIREVTGALARKPGIIEPSLQIDIAQDVDYYVNSEGTVLRTTASLYTMWLSAWARAEDGVRLWNFRHYEVRDAAELPDRQTLLRDAEALYQELEALRKAEPFKPYSGPAILAPDVAGVFFHEALGHRLEGERQRADESGQTFRDKLGEKVVSEHISIVDDPTQERFGGKTLAGYYRYDSEGVPAQRVTLVEKGVLRNYLLSRTPIKGFDRSNGHGRSQEPASNLYPGHAVGRMANFIVSSEKRHSFQQLKEMLMDEAKRQGKPYGLIVRHVRQGETETQRGGAEGGRVQSFRASPILVYTVDAATGEEKLVRGVEIVGTPLASLEKVLATGDDDTVFNGSCGAETGWLPASVVSPSILTAQVELQRVNVSPRREPILPSPFQEE